MFQLKSKRFLLKQDRVNEFIAQHAGSSDILDAMLKTFGQPAAQANQAQSPVASKHRYLISHRM